MPRRLIREGILDSRAVNSLSESGELLYRRLMSALDDYGRFELDLDIIRARCFALQLDNWPVSRIAAHMYEMSGGSPLIAEQYRTIAVPEPEHGQGPLVTIYAVGFKVYMQLNNFGQRIQAKSKCPEPPPDTAVAAPPKPVKEPVAALVPAQANSNAHSGGGAGSSVPSWALDETYVAFAELCRQFWPRILDEEIINGHVFHWKKFSFEQRLVATKNLRDRVAAGEDGEFVKHMPDYLKSEWKRGPKPRNETTRPKIHQPSDTRYVD